MRSLRRLLPAALLLLAACPGSGWPPWKPNPPSRFVFGPSIQHFKYADRDFEIAAWPPDPSSTDAISVAGLGIAAAEAAIKHWSAVLSTEAPGELAAMQRSLAPGGSPAVTVGKELSEFVQFGLTAARATNGAFDPTGGAWEQARLGGLALHVPTGRYDPGMLVDGWLADRAVKALREAGITKATVAVGQQRIVAVLGAPVSNSAPTDFPLGIALSSLENRSIAAMEVAGTSAAVVADNASAAVVFLHALIALPPEEAIGLLERRHAEGMRRDPKGDKVWTTSGWATLTKD